MCSVIPVSLSIPQWECAAKKDFKDLAEKIAAQIGMPLWKWMVYPWIFCSCGKDHVVLQSSKWKCGSVSKYSDLLSAFFSFLLFGITFYSAAINH